MTEAVRLDVVRQVGGFHLNVAFAVESGLAVLFGPSGSGKSLTLAMIAGLMRPDAGTIEINGRTVADPARRVHVSTQDRAIGMVFQEGLLLPHRTVLANVMLAVRHPVDRRQRKDVAFGWLDQVGAAGLADRRPGSLSGGQRQRVALARALVGDPALVLLDEPLSALDEDVRGELGALIREVVTSAGVPALLVTHDRDEAELLGDLIIEYKQGTVVGLRPILRPIAGVFDPRARPESEPTSGSGPA